MSPSAESIDPPASIPLARIDRGIARSVRDGLDDDHVDRLEVAFAAGKAVTPVDVFAWQGCPAYLLADGEHRCEARGRAKFDTITATIHHLPTEDAARAAALAFALSANEHPAKPRTPADKRATVRTALLSGRYDAASDRDLEEVCKVGRYLIRQVRIALTVSGEITGQVSADGRYADLTASGRGATWDAAHAEVTARSGEPDDDPEPDEPGDDPDGTDLYPPDDDADEPIPPKYGEPVGEADPDPEPDPEPDPDPFPPAGGAAVKPARRVKDAIGRVIPRPMLKTFNADLPDVEGVDVPYCVCPLVLDNGEHHQQGRCYVCTTGKHQNRGWLTETQYKGLSAQLQSLCTTGPMPEAPHRYADLMKQVTSLSRAVTTAINQPENSVLLRYLTDCKLVERWDKIIDGKRSVGAFKLLRGLRRIIDLAGRGGPELRTARILSEYDAAKNTAEAA